MPDTPDEFLTELGLPPVPENADGTTDWPAFARQLRGLPDDATIDPQDAPGSTGGQWSSYWMVPTAVDLSEPFVAADEHKSWPDPPEPEEEPEPRLYTPDPEGLVAVAEADVPCPNTVTPWEDCQPGTRIPPTHGRCGYCGQQAPVLSAADDEFMASPVYSWVSRTTGWSGGISVSSSNEVVGHNWRVKVVFAPHTMHVRRELRWMEPNEKPDYDEQDYYTAKIPDGPEWSWNWSVPAVDLLDGDG
jgi:hypothetical protein